MNEFIVWDDEDNKFISWEDVTFTKDKNDDFIIIMKEIDTTLSEGRNFKTFNYVGLKDTDNKKIYADSSIVEIDYLYLKCKIKAYFFFSEATLSYHIRTLERFDGRSFKYDFEAMLNIKIIDTIQENKLGLIKDKEQ